MQEIPQIKNIRTVLSLVKKKIVQKSFVTTEQSVVGTSFGILLYYLVNLFAVLCGTSFRRHGMPHSVGSEAAAYTKMSINIPYRRNEVPQLTVLE
jgi:hypothetical protein